MSVKKEHLREAEVHQSEIVELFQNIVLQNKIRKTFHHLQHMASLKDSENLETFLKKKRPKIN